MNDDQTAEYIAGRGAGAAMKQEEMLQRVQDAKQALRLAMGTVNEEWMRADERAKAMLEQTRQWRMAMGNELSKVMADCADVRKFFLSPDHEKEVARLRDFVDLCERLQKLKQSGFLDSVADTILKLEKA